MMGDWVNMLKKYLDITFNKYLDGFLHDHLLGLGEAQVGEDGQAVRLEVGGGVLLHQPHHPVLEAAEHSGGKLKLLVGFL